MNPHSLLAAGFALFALGLALPCPSHAQTNPVQVTNLGYDSLQTRVDAGRVAFLVQEYQQGGLDLNGDGDSMDAVPHLHDLTSGTTTNLGRAVTNWLAMDRGHIAFKVYESAHGAVDLNGDGDALDSILHVYDPLTGIVQNLGLCVPFDSGVSMGEGVVAAGVLEYDQGSTDLNGDGDFGDTVLHIHDLGTGSTTNTGFALQRIEDRWIGEGCVAFEVPEHAQGLTDLNGDGDFGDRVWHTFDLAGKTVRNSGFAGDVVELTHGHMLLPVLEGSQGHTDLNGDGDDLDRVLHLVRLSDGATTNLGLAILGVTPAGTHAVTRVYELTQFGLDLNSDGDANDFVAHVIDLRDYSVLNLGLAVSGTVSDGERVAFKVSESDQHVTDHNGDGDASDDVVYVYDPIRNTSTNLWLAGGDIWIRGHRVMVTVYELDQGQTDLNGDGDTWDYVRHDHDLGTGVTTNRALVVDSNSDEGIDALFHVSEFSQKADLNGDGDQHDTVLFAHDWLGGAPYNLAIPATVEAFDEGLAAFLTYEGWYTPPTDLNGDGDTTDNVLHLARPTYPCGLETDRDSLSLLAGGAQSFELDAGSFFAGHLYLLLGSLSGTSPGVTAGPGTVLPLVWDPYFEWTLRSPNNPPLAGSLGSLDSWGEASAALTLPAGTKPALAGLTLHHAYAVFDPLSPGIVHISNPAPLLFAP